MTLNNINNLKNLNSTGLLKVLNHTGAIRNAKGFTIVELLIVIVVIAILATISIVAYSGIQTRAKATKAKANAASVQKTAEMYYADNSAYPTTRAQFNNTTVRLPASVTLLTSGSLSGTNGEDSIMYRYVTAGTGACVVYWDFSSGSGAYSAPLLMGTATSGTCNSTTGTFPT